MQQTVTLKFKKNEEAFYRHTFPYLCEHKVRKYFDFPKLNDGDEIEVTLSTNEIAESYKVNMSGMGVKIKNNQRGPWTGEYVYSFARNYLRRFLKRSGQRFCYVSIDY